MTVSATWRTSLRVPDLGTSLHLAGAVPSRILFKWLFLRKSLLSCSPSASSSTSSSCNVCIEDLRSVCSYIALDQVRLAMNQQELGSVGYKYVSSSQLTSGGDSSYPHTYFPRVIDGLTTAVELATVVLGRTANQVQPSGTSKASVINIYIYIYIYIYIQREREREREREFVADYF